MSNKIFKGLDYDGNTLAIIAVKDEDTAWVWATGSELPIHSFAEINPDMAKCVVLAKAVEYHTGDLADRWSKRRFDQSNTYLLK